MKLEETESLPEGLKRIAREQLDEAVDGLRAQSGSAEAGERVHGARKCLKKARAVIRLVREEVGEDFFKRENVRFRDAGRELAPVRDADVQVATLDRLIGSGALDGEEMGPLRERLDKRRAGARRRAQEEGTAERVAELVAEGRAMVDCWPIDRVDSRAFRKSLKRTYERARKARSSAYEKPSPKRMHELRKRIKYLWYYSRFLHPAASGELGELKDRTDEVSDLLGLDHDLAELLDAAGEHGGLRGGELEQRLRRAVEQERLRLQWQAWPLLRRILAEPPGGFSRRIAARFDAWRTELDPQARLWLTPESAEHARGLLERKSDADAAGQDSIRRELRGAGIELAELAAGVAGAGAGFRAEHLDELIERGSIRVGGAPDFADLPPADRLSHTDVDVGPNEASGICPIHSPQALETRGWDMGFWVVLDDTSVEEGVVAVGRSPASGFAWEAERLPIAGDGKPATDDGEDCVRVGEWVYVFGSHYGSKEGPLESERQFIARFREAQLGAGAVDLQVAKTGFRLHRLINDALAASGIELFPLAQQARSALVGGALAEEEAEDGDREQRIEADDLPINIEGCALRSDTGGVLIGLRFPTSAEGHPLAVEVDDLGAAFDSGSGMPTVRGVWEFPGIGSPQVPAGIRGLAEGPEGAIELICGNLDSTGKGSVLIDAHPEAALARSAHLRARLPGNRRHGRAESALVREFPGMMRIEGVAHDPVGRTFYVIDEAERVDLRYSEPEAPGAD